MPAAPTAATPPLPAPGAVGVWRFAHQPGERSTPRVRQVLGRCLGLQAQAVTLATGAHGAPVLAPGAVDASGARVDIGVSASHAGDWLLVAAARGLQPGVDIERIAPRPNALAIAHRYFTADEAGWLAGLPGPQRELAFYRLWVAREAVLKAIGRGLAFGLDRLRIDPDPRAPSLRWLDGDDASAWVLHWLDVPEGYLGAVAWRGGPRSITCSPGTYS